MLVESIVANICRPLLLITGGCRSERERLARFKRIETARASKRVRYIYCYDQASAVAKSIVLEFFDKEFVDRSVLLILVTGIGHNDLGAELLQLLG